MVAEGKLDMPLGKRIPLTPALRVSQPSGRMLELR